MFSKRVENDIKLFNSTKPTNIHIFPDNETKTIRAMIIGHEDTPYKHGFYFFSITFPENNTTGKYPFVPPIVQFETGDGRTRFNPNLYVCGKVCLSILGTWSGPAWSPAGTFMTVLLSIQSDVMTSDPIKNEPGFEKSCKKDVDEYNEVIEHQNFSVALIKQFLNLPPGFEVFHEIMKTYLMKNNIKIIQTLKNNVSAYENKSIFKSHYASSKTENKYSDILQQFMNIKEVKISRCITDNKELIDNSETSTCIFCMKVVKCNDIKEYTDDTGICPYCNVDALVPSLCDIDRKELDEWRNILFNN